MAAQPNVDDLGGAAVKEELPPPEFDHPLPGSAGAAAFKQERGDSASGIERKVEGAGTPANALDEQLAVDGLQQRAAAMFLGERGASIASGEPALVQRASNRLLLFAAAAIHALYEQHRSELQGLSKEVALGYLIADVLGCCSLELDSAREIGKRIGKQISTVQKKIEKIRQRAKERRKGARDAAKKNQERAEQLDTTITQIDGEAAAARAKLEAETYDPQLPTHAEEKPQPKAKRDRLAEAKAQLELAIAAVPIAEAAAAAARRKRQQADEAVEQAQSWFKYKPDMSDEEWQARMERCQELQSLQLERLGAECDTESDLHDAKQGVMWARELVERVEGILSAARAEKDARSAQLAAAREDVLRLQQEYAESKARLVESEEREADLHADMESSLARLHVAEVADTRRRLESDADRVWGPGWRDR